MVQTPERYLRKYTAFLIAFTLLCACNDNKQKLIGAWVIQKAVINQKDISIYDFAVNSIVFKDNGTCVLPAIDDFDEKAKWEIKEQNNQYTLKITSRIWCFNNEFKLRFNKGGGIFTMASEKASFTCIKMW